MAVTARIRRETIPNGLQTTDQWICWRADDRDGKQTKRPVSPTGRGYATVDDPATWTGFDTALDTVRDRPDVDGIGFVFTDSDPYVGVDLDDCRDSETGTLDAWGRDIIDTLDSYTEISPSGTGIHVIASGEVPGDRKRRGDVEMYDDARFFTVTGDRLADSPTQIRDATRIGAVHDDYLTTDDGDDAALSEFESDDGGGPTGTDDSGGADECTTSETDEASKEWPEETGANDLSDDEILRKARTARNSERFHRLWMGNTGGYDSQSEADLALCNILAFWTGKDPAQMDRLFRRSGLMRPKWDDEDTAGNHYADGTTYGEKTIERALKRVETTYGGG